VRKKSALADVSTPVALPKESYWVGNYQGYEDSDLHWFTPKSKTDNPATFGSLVHDAKTNAAKHDVVFPVELGRPGIRENLHKTANMFEAHSAKSKPEETRGAVAKPAGLFDGPEYADRPEPQWLIRNIAVEAGYSIASGRSQAGKSFCELAQALSIATGKPWLGEPIEKMGPVLYVAAEGQGRIWKDVRAWCAEFEVDPESLRGRFFIYDHSARLNTDAGRDALSDILGYIEHIAGRPPILAVFDTLRRNMRGGVSQEEPTSEVLHAVNELQAAGIAVTLIAHHGRGHDETKGLTEWEDDADQACIYHGTVRDRTTSIEFKKVKNSEDGWSLAVKYTTHQLPDGTTTIVAVAGRRKERGEKIDSSTDLFKKSTEERAAMQILEDSDPPNMDRKDLARAVCQQLHPGLEKNEPESFRQGVQNLSRKFGRLKHGELFEYAAERGSGRNQEILSFAKPGRGRRVGRPKH
jgi:hypothetical protein